MKVAIEKATKEQLKRALERRVNITGSESKFTLIQVARLIGLKEVRA